MPQRWRRRCDDYGGYKALFANGIAELACWAHARRKFFDVHEARASPLAKEALERIGALYAIEAKPRDLDAVTRHGERQRYLAPKLDERNGWLDNLSTVVLGNTGLAGAVRYTLRRWSALARVLDNGRQPIDNNPIENAIRPIAIGRKTGSSPAPKPPASAPPPS